MKRVDFTLPPVFCPVQSTIPIAYPCITQATTLQCYDLAGTIHGYLVNGDRLRYNEYFRRNRGAK